MPHQFVAENTIVDDMRGFADKRVDIIGIYIYGSVAPGFLKTRAGSGDNRRPYSYGLDYGQSETFVARRIDTKRGIGIYGREIGERYAFEMHYTV